MFYIKIADLVIKINNVHDEIYDVCRDFILESKNFDFEVGISEKRIEKNFRNVKENGKKALAWHCEFMLIYSEICTKIIEYEGIFLHSAVIEFDGTGYAFCAPSGMGKSTHVQLWEKYFKDRVSIINGDKPIIRIIDNKVYAYGTPWCGKERLCKNKRVELKAVCFFMRGENVVKNISIDEAVDFIFPQIFKPAGRDATKKTLDILEHIMERVKLYKAECDISEKAVLSVYECFYG